jgi:chromosome segregation ATPase
MAITKSDIFSAANAIAAEGGSPTLAAVRKALGGGSFTTISEGMQEWRIKHKARQEAEPLREAAPVAVTDKLNELGFEVWAIALELANARLQHEREALELTRQELEESQAEAVELCDSISADLEQAQATIQQQEEAIEIQVRQALESIAAYKDEKLARQQAERKIEVIEATMSEVRHQVDALRSEGVALKGELSESIKKLAVAEERLSSVTGQFDQAKTELEKALATLSKKDAIIQELKIQGAKDQSEITNFSNRLDQVQAELEKALRKISEKDELIIELKTQIAAAQAEKTTRDTTA